MAKKKKISAEVIAQSLLAEGVMDLRLRCSLAEDACPGQFVGIYPKNKATLLPRPISICDFDADEQTLRIVYRIAGSGTAEFSLYQAGDSVDVLGVLGNGFPLEKAAGKRALIIGGGIGVPPLLGLAKALNGGNSPENGNSAAHESTTAGAANNTSSDGAHIDATINTALGVPHIDAANSAAPSEIHLVMGYRDSENFLSEEFKQYGNLHIATEDGSVGTKGNVIDACKAENITADVIYACGPMPMLRGVKAYAEEIGAKAYLSLEERMACGVGACLGCICKTKNVDEHSHVKNARICTDGPVFDADELDL